MHLIISADFLFLSQLYLLPKDICNFEIKWEFVQWREKKKNLQIEEWTQNAAVSGCHKIQNESGDPTIF